MIRNAPRMRGSGPGYRRHLGQASAALAFNPVTAGISAGVSLASTAVSDWMNSIQLSHNADTATTLIVNGLATQLANLDKAYFAENPPSCADQRAALDAYDESWAWLQSPAACGNPNYGRAGNACISDRAPGGKFPWQTYYRDPIANDARLASEACDTSQQVILPSLTTGTYSPTGITAGGQLDITTPPPAAVSSETQGSDETAPPPSPAPGLSVNPSSLSPALVFAVLGLGALLLIK